MNKTTLILFVLVLLPSYVLTGYEAKACDYERELDGKVAWQPGQLIEIQAGAGDLQIQGDAESKQLKFIARLCASDKKIGEQLNVVVGEDDGELKLVTRYPDSKPSWFGDNYALIDLRVEVPKQARLRVFDSSGEASVANVAALVMTDSSGELSIKRIDGALKVTDSSGEMNLSEIGGAVVVTDSSGDINISNVQGEVTIEVDSSGDMHLKNVSGNVLVEKDSSGSIRVANVGGNFDVLADTSGDISHSNVAGKVSLPN